MTETWDQKQNILATLRWILPQILPSQKELKQAVTEEIARLEKELHR